MRLISVLIFCIISASCLEVETASNTAPTNTNDFVTETGLLKPVKPNVKLNAKRQKYLDGSLPPQVREILEKAETFEILADVNTEPTESREVKPNRKVVITSETEKKNILETFYLDASNEDSPANCFQPHHSIQAKYGDKNVEIIICFDCSRFEVKSSFGYFGGTIVRKNIKSDKLFKQIVANEGVVIK